jgi:predicted small lipoprotein YifL
LGTVVKWRYSTVRGNGQIGRNGTQTNASAAARAANWEAAAPTSPPRGFRLYCRATRSQFVNPRTPFDQIKPHLRTSPARRKARFAWPAALALLAVAALSVGGCGRAGPLEPPPDPNAVAKPADADPTHPQARHKPPPITAPKAPFILDPLL